MVGRVFPYPTEGRQPFPPCGMIGDKNALPFLKKKFSQYTDIEQVMALKSIGDIGTPEAIEFVKNAQQHTQYSNELGFKFATDLYLQALSK